MNVNKTERIDKYWSSSCFTCSIFSAKMEARSSISLSVMPSSGFSGVSSSTELLLNVNILARLPNRLQKRNQLSLPLLVVVVVVVASSSSGSGGGGGGGGGSGSGSGSGSGGGGGSGSGSGGGGGSGSGSGSSSSNSRSSVLLQCYY